MRIGAILAAAVVAAWLLGPQPATAQDAGTSAPPAADQQQKRLSEAELDQLVAPIALYPDPLLAQVLMASTYPLEIVQAARFAKSNKSLTGDALDTALAKEDWDASVKALVATPTVIAMMNDQLDWTQNLGDAVLAQQADVMDAIQRLRVKAEANGKLETTAEQKVTTTQEAGKEVIVIEPASPETVYVPYYEPSVVYGILALSRLSALLLRAGARLGGRRRDRDGSCLGRRLGDRQRRLGRFRLGPRKHQCRHQQEREHRPEYHQERHQCR